MRITFILSFLMIYGASASAQDATGTLHGNIVDTTPQQTPISDVRVVIVSTDGREYETTTDSSGEYETGLPPGRYLISIYKDGYGAREGKPVTIVVGGDHYVPMKMTKVRGFINFAVGLLQLISVLFFIVMVVAIVKIFTMSRDIKEIKDLLKTNIERRNESRGL
ncbi:MAG: carboxypeptidase-like regulatory domain-containing protein [Candidatus Poribacteria bacterium]|nr:carboxypeptidase-like regulatory domain-containing protein [Candidatus Poribacteria bacterium]